jgi:hypothetical protein
MQNGLSLVVPCAVIVYASHASTPNGNCPVLDGGAFFIPTGVRLVRFGQGRALRGGGCVNGFDSLGVGRIFISSCSRDAVLAADHDLAVEQA